MRMVDAGGHCTVWTGLSLHCCFWLHWMDQLPPAQTDRPGAQFLFDCTLKPQRMNKDSLFRKESEPRNHSSEKIYHPHRLMKCSISQSRYELNDNSFVSAHPHPETKRTVVQRWIFLLSQHGAVSCPSVSTPNHALFFWFPIVKTKQQMIKIRIRFQMKSGFSKWNQIESKRRQTLPVCQIFYLRKKFRRVSEEISKMSQIVVSFARPPKSQDPRVFFCAFYKTIPVRWILHF